MCLCVSRGGGGGAFIIPPFIFMGGILKGTLSLPLTLPLSHEVNGTLMECKIGILKAQLTVH